MQLHVPFMHMEFSSPLLVQLIVRLQKEPRTEMHGLQSESFSDHMCISTEHLLVYMYACEIRLKVKDMKQTQSKRFAVPTLRGMNGTLS